MTAKSEQTKQLVIDTALSMFRAQGYAKTTMRGIATTAGISLGSAYYYFESKDDLVQELYAQVQLDHRALALAVIADEPNFARRLALVVDAGITVMQPFHSFGGAFIQTAISPSSATNPFSEASADSKQDSIELFRETLNGSSLRLPASLRADLPELLWLGYLALVYFWVGDRSEAQTRTRNLAAGAAPLIARTIGLAKLPIARKLVEDALSLLRKTRA